MKEIRCIKTGGLEELTFNKEYEVIAEDMSWYRIMNDNGLKDGYQKHLFEEIKEDNAYTGWEICKMISEGMLKDGDRLKDDTFEYLVKIEALYSSRDNYKTEVACSYLTTRGYTYIVLERKTVVFEEARKEYRDNKKTIKSCVSERVFKNGIDTEIGFSEIEGQWIVLD